MDKLCPVADNKTMTPSTEETLQQYEKFSKEFRLKIAQDPREAVEALVRAGILLRPTSPKAKPRLAPRYGRKMRSGK